MNGNGESVFDGPKTLCLDAAIEAVEIDASVQRIIRIILKNSKGLKKIYHLKITPKGGAVLV